MNAAGGESQDHIARADASAGDLLAALHRTDGEPSQIKVAGRVQSGHLRRLAADQGAARLHAACGNAVQHRLGSDRIERVTYAGAKHTLFETREREHTASWVHRCYVWH